MKICASFAILIAAMSSALPAWAEGDVEYGQYLSSECVTCHQATNTDASIPVINGMDAEAMAEILKMYRAEELENPAMQTVAKRLLDKDIEALAAYFASLSEPE